MANITKFEILDIIDRFPRQIQTREDVEQYFKTYTYLDDYIRDEIKMSVLRSLNSYSKNLLSQALTLIHNAFINYSKTMCLTSMNDLENIGDKLSGETQELINEEILEYRKKFENETNVYFFLLNNLMIGEK